MNLLIWLTTGVLVAWLARLGRPTLGRQRLLIEVLFAASGALMGGLISVRSDLWFAAETNWPGVAAAAMGAAVLLFIANLHALRSGQAG